MKTLALSLVTCFALSTTAFAQVGDDDPIPTTSDEGAGDEVEMGDDDAPAVPFDEEGSPSGAEENPDAPQLGKVLGPKQPKHVDHVSMRKLVSRPLTLPGNTFQLGLRGGFGPLSEKIAYAYPGNDELVRLGAVVSASYGITDQIQVGINYGTGTLGKAKNPITDEGDTSYEVGKTIEVEARYRIEKWVAAQIRVPINVDPVNAALTLGAPMKFRFGDKLALFVFEDFLTFKFNDFVPMTDDAVANAAAATATESNTQLPDGDITVKGGVIYQMSEKAAFKGTFGIVAPDFSLDNDPGVPLVGELFYSMSEKLDLYCSAGIYSLADAGTTLHAGGGINFRL